MNTTSCRFILSTLVALITLTATSAAHAACTMPGGAPNAVAGDILYNTDHAVMQYCNGTSWIAMGSSGGSSLPVCGDNEILQYDDGNDEWDCTPMTAAEVDPQINTLTNNKWCTSNGTVVNCASDLPIGTLTNAKFCTTNGTTISCTSDGPAEADPQVGTLTNTKWCTTDGIAINCTSDAPVTSESDPQVGTITGTKWCAANAGGTAIDCTQNTPGGGASGDIQTFNASGTWTKPATGTLAIVECWGGGGGGARYSLAGGGGGGGYNMKWLPLSALGATETVTIGTGGAGRTGSDGMGSDGGNSTFGAHLTAYAGAGGRLDTGGGGGGGGPAGAASGPTPGNPQLITAAGYGLAPSQGYGGFYAVSGYSGSAMPGSGGFWHGGGGGCGSSGGPTVGGNSFYGGGGGGSFTSTFGAAGGTSLNGGNGGAGGASSGAAGTAGTQPGGGGGARNANGGNGGAGRCKITVF